MAVCDQRRKLVLCSDDESGLGEDEMSVSVTLTISDSLWAERVSPAYNGVFGIIDPETGTNRINPDTGQPYTNGQWAKFQLKNQIRGVVLEWERRSLEATEQAAIAAASAEVDAGVT